jgi:hypothetical protein
VSGLPGYVSWLGRGEVAMPPPGQVDRATVAMFGLPVTDRDRLQRMVDTMLTARGGPTYHVLGSTVLVCFLASPRLTSASEPIGSVADHEVAVWVPLVERRGDAVRLRVWMPYLWVDTDIAMVTGREVWGFPKELGHYRPPAAGEPYVLRAPVFRRFGPDVEAEEVDLLRVDAASHPTTSAWHDLEDAAHGLAELLGWSSTRAHLSWRDDARLLLDLLEVAGHRRIPVVNLKQFRDAADPTRACYQALVASDLQVTGFHGGGPLWGEHRVTVTRCASHDLVGDLGLAGTEVVARFGVWVTMDFLVPAGEVVWQAP